MKKLVVFAMVLCLTAMTTIRAEEPPKTSPHEGGQGECDLKILEVKAWDDVVYKLVPPPAEDGNAVEYLLKANHGQLIEGKPEATQTDTLDKIYPWWNETKGEFWLSQEEKDKALTAEAIKIPELDLIVKASQQKKYQFYGIYSTPSPDPQKMIFSMPLMNFANIVKLSKILAARAYSKAEKGDKAGAEADMLASVRVGHIMQRDVTMIGFMIGISIENAAAKRMPDFYKKIGNDAKAEEWTQLLPETEKHRDAAKALLKINSVAKLKAIVTDANLPRSARNEGLLAVVTYSLAQTKTKGVMGVPKETKEFITRELFSDPEMIILQLKLIEDVYVGVFTSAKNRMALAAIEDSE